MVSKIANEEDTIQAFTMDLLGQFDLAHRKGVDCNLIYVVDPFSVDKTHEIVNRIAASDERVKVFWNDNAKTLIDSDIFAFRKGLESQSEWIVDINAGYRHKPEDLSKFIEFIFDRTALIGVFGSRYCQNGSSIVKSRQRNFLSRGGTSIGNFLLGTNFSDLTSGFMMLRREILEEVLKAPIRSKYHFLQTELKFKIWNESREIEEIPIEYRSNSGPLGPAVILDAIVNLLFFTFLRLKNFRRASL